MKNILIIGAGRSATTLIAYFLEHSEANDWHITVGDISAELCEKKIGGHPNIISEHEINYILPEIPVVASAPSCVPFGPSGISLTGSAIYHGSSTLGNDAAAHEMLDRFGGHTDGTERYHYHYPSQDLQDHIHPHSSGHSPIMGYMLDGFGIYGPYGENGELLHSEDLDECHGHTHSVLWDGEMIDLYHYHWTYDFPYNIGCFKGTPQ